MKIVSVIPIKLNNERLPHKNTKMLGNKPLIKYILNTLKTIEKIDDVYVYCSSDEICQYLDSNVKFLKRPKYLDLPTANFTQIFESFMSEVDADIYVYAHATAPFITKDTINEELNAVISGEYDSSFTAEKIQDFLWQNGEPLNFDAKNLPRSQDLSCLYRETSGVYVFTKEVFEKYKRRIGINPKIIEVNKKEMIDINYPEDFQLAEKMLDSSDLEKYKKRIALLDCTLRDGGCVNNFNFGSIAMNKIKRAIENSNIEYIELGYINSKKGSKEERTQFLDVDDVNKFLGKKKENATYVAMIDYGTYDFNELPFRRKEGIDGIRIAFHKKDCDNAIKAAKIISEKGYKVFIQPMVIMSYSDNEIISLVRKINIIVPEATAFYIVDSFGEMQFGDCSRILKIVDEHLIKDMAVGFHGHNNLQLAYSNSLELLSNDVNRRLMLDSSLNGMGKGAGNVPSELIMNYLNDNYQKNYNLIPVYKIINDVIEFFKPEYSWGYSTNYLLSSLNECTPSYVNFFINKCNVKSDELSLLLSMLSDDKKVAFNEEYAKSIYNEYLNSLSQQSVVGRSR